MTPEAKDFSAECAQIETLLIARDAGIFDTETLFKRWTIGDIIGHLHLWNIAADLSLRAPDEFQAFILKAMTAMRAGQSHLDFQRHYFGRKTHAEIFTDWTKFYPGMAERFFVADPEQRVKWVGPDMSVRSSIIARQMEHWAHAQAIFDVLGLDRENGARLKNIAHIGVTTFSWSFKVRGKTPPQPKPFVRLIAPDGEVWTWNDPQSDNRIDGSAEAFCQTVTQCRNVADTDLVCTGAIALDWMAHAQCFAGGAETPPAPGTRFKRITS